MNEARHSILSQLRLGTDTSKNRCEALERLRQPVPGPRPAQHRDTVEMFIEKLRGNSASVDRARNEDELMRAVGDFFDQYSLSPELCVVPHPLLQKLPLPGDLHIEHRPAVAKDGNVLGLAAYGIAETGALVMLSSAETPSEANFLPDNILCLIRHQTILTDMEALWERLRQNGEWPMIVNLVSGPSRTADVEQTIQLGAHGPRRLHVVVMEGDLN